MGRVHQFQPGDVVFFYDNAGVLLKGTITKPNNYMANWFHVRTLKGEWCVPAREFIISK